MTASFAQENVAYGKNELIELTNGYLQQEGFLPELDADGDITFKYQGQRVYIIVHEDDQNFFLFMMPQFTAQGEDELIQSLIACNHATKKTKVAKAYVNDKNRVIISAEILVPEPGDVGSVIKRSLETMMSCKKNLGEKLLELQE